MSENIFKPTEKPYSPKSLAERWDCSDQHVRDLCRSGHIHFFRLGNMIRISAEEVYKFEQCGGSSSIEESGVLSVGKTEAQSVYPFVPPTGVRHKDDSTTL